MMIKAAAYAGLSTGLPDIGGSQSAWVMNYANHSRIQQTGWIGAIDIYLAGIPYELTDLIFTVWRFNGVTYDRIGSQSIFNQLTGGGVHHITFPESMPVQIGDLTGIEWIVNGASPHFMKGVYSPGGCYYSMVEPGASDYAWQNQGLTDVYVPIQVYMIPPTVIFIGDSIVSGYPAYYPPSCGLGVGGDITASFPHKVSTEMGWSYQNAGAGGQRTDQILARFLTDVIDKKPVGVFIDGGANDVQQGVSSSDTLGNVATMFDLCHANSIIPFFILVPPFTHATIPECRATDELNYNLINLCNANGVTVIDFRHLVGEFRPGCDEGNIWNTRKEFDCGDGVHLNSAGNDVVAGEVIRVVNEYLKNQAA